MRAVLVALVVPFLLAAGAGDPPAGTTALTIAEEGGLASTEHRAAVSGILRVWVESADFDPVLAVVDGAGARVEDDDSGGRPAPWLDLAVQAGESRRIEVSAKSGHGSARLVVVELAEDDASREAARAFRARIEAAVAGLATADARARREELVATAAELAAHPRLRDGDALQSVLLDAILNLSDAGEHTSVLAAAETLVELQRDLLPPDSLRRLSAVRWRANALGQLGRPAEAVEAQRGVLEALRRTLAPDDPELWMARSHLATVLFQAGEHRAAVDAWDALVRAPPGTGPRFDRAVVQLRANLAVGAYYLGDLDRARAQAEAARAARDVLVPGSPLEQQIRAVLSAVLAEQGDHQAARALTAEALAIARASLPPGHVELAIAEVNFALAQVRAGEFAPARETLARVLANPPEGLAASHPLLVRARANLAAVDVYTGRSEDALATLGALLDELGSEVPSTNAVVRALRRNQALALIGLGRYEEAADVEVDLLAATCAVLPPDHPERLRVEFQRAATDGLLGRRDAARASVLAAAAALREMLVARSLILSPREAESAVQGLRTILDEALDSLLDARIGGQGPAGVAAAFELSETARGIGLAAQRSLRATQSGGERARALRDTARAAQIDLVRAAQSADAETVLRCVEARDSAERALRAELARAGATPRTISAAGLAGRLPDDTAAVAWRVRTVAPRDGAAASDRSEWLVAFLVQPGEPVRCIDLGALEPCAAACRAWRAELEHTPHDAARAREAGERVRTLVLDPVRRAAPRAQRWIVTPDGPLLTIPLDALPDTPPAAGARRDALVGDTLHVVTTWSFEGSAVPPVASVANASHADTTESLLLVGDPALPAAGRWQPLPGTGREIEAIAATWRDARGAEASARALRGRDATPGALSAGVAGAQWIHVATHGAFDEDPGSRSLLTAPAEDDALDPRRAVLGMLPLVRCELVLAGGSEGSSASLSAEELAGLDLHACRLAVLSACETGRGEIVLGQGAASFQRALLAAGAQSCLTALWRVPDDATRELMTAFYRGLWTDRLEPEEALWRAKSALRSRRAPPRDWAGWVLASSLGS